MIHPDLITDCTFDFDKFFLRDETSIPGIVVFNFNEDLAKEFVSQIIIPFRRSYISDDDLDYEVKNDINVREEAIGNKLPTKPSLRSGEFAEILMYFISCHFLAPDANITPIKWHWKENCDMPCHLTDIAIFKCGDYQHPSEDDYFFSMEVKSAATPIGKRSKESKMNEAIEGALKDRVSRMAKMIAYLTTKYVRERKKEIALYVKRFDESIETKYIRHINAAIVVERDSLENHINNMTGEMISLATHNRIALFAVPINHLKETYEAVYTQTPIMG